MLRSQIQLKALFQTVYGRINYLIENISQKIKYD